MKTFVKHILAAAAAAGMVACSDFLDIRPEGTAASSGMDYAKSENIFKPVSAAYASLRGKAHGFAYLCAFEITSDDADKGSTPEDNPDALSLDRFTFGPSQRLINELWTGYYDIVSAANNALYQLPLFAERTQNAETLQTIKECTAETKFLRAYAYFNLVRMFGRVPIIDKVMTSEELASVSQSEASAVYGFIETDLEAGCSDLPENYPKSYAGRVNRYSAMALKAKVHLYQKEYAEAAALCDQIIASGRYSLLSSFNEVFSMEGENSKESLFEIQSSTLSQSSGKAPYMEFAFYQGPRNNTPSNMQGWGFCTPSNKLIEFFRDRGETIRPATTLLYRGSTREGCLISASCPNPVYNGKVFVPAGYNKWSYNGYGFDYNIRILRYADVLLMYAESLSRGAPVGSLSGMTAQDALDMVRTRAGLSSIAPSTDNILDERHAELALEEDRFFDLVRTGKAAAELSSLGYVEGKNNVFPIPSQQRQLNINLTQNPDY